MEQVQASDQNRIPPSQLALILTLLAVSVVLTLVSQMIGLALSLFLFLLSKRLSRNLHQERGDNYLASYLRAISLCAVRLYFFLTVGLIVLLSYLSTGTDVSTGLSLVSNNAESGNHDAMIYAAALGLSIYFLFLCTAMKILFHVMAGRSETCGGYVDTLVEFVGFWARFFKKGER